MESVRVSFLNVICLLNVIYILVKYHENTLTCFKVMVCTKFLQFRRQGDITHRPSQSCLSCTRHPFQMPSTTWQSFMKIHVAQRVLRSYGVHNNAFMDRQRRDGWMDSMLIAIISPKPVSRRITKFNKRSWWYSYINFDANVCTFIWNFCDLDRKIIPQDGDHAE